MTQSVKARTKAWAVPQTNSLDIKKPLEITNRTKEEKALAEKEELLAFLDKWADRELRFYQWIASWFLNEEQMVEFKRKQAENIARFEQENS
jgi:hypothetical protein